MLGAEFTEVWARRRGAGIEPADDAVRVEERTVHTRGTPDGGEAPPERGGI